MKNSTDPEALRRLIHESVLDPEFRRGTFAGPIRGSSPSPWLRVIVRPVAIRGERQLQFSYFDQRKDISKNFTEQEARAPLNELIDISYSGIHLSTAGEEIDIRTSTKGKVCVSRQRTLDSKGQGAERIHAESHNRVKELPLPEGKSDRLLEVMGILTADGRVRPTMRPKFTQINEFLKQLIHVLEPSGFRTLGRPIEILDCGCGSSYLTLAVHHYLNDLAGLPARITGIDVNDEVIRKSMDRAERLSATGLAFTCGRISDLHVQHDIVLALHACDTATDDAIAQAISTNAAVLLAVPCCHKYLNRAIRPAQEAEVLRPMLRHGILRQRMADLATDSFRALILGIMGYQTEVVEFVSTEQTARNLMIRAIRTGKPGDPELIREYLALRRFWNVTPYLETLLAAQFQELLS